MKTVGIIGGLGPETTSEFYLALVFGCAQVARDHRPAILTWNVPLPYAVEEAALTKGAEVEKYIPYLQDAARRLEAGGADFLVIPCNTVHCYIEEVRSVVSIPVLSVVDSAVEFLQRNEIDHVGLIATGITLRTGFYQAALNASGIGMTMPDEFQQARLARMIYGLVTNRYANHHRHELLDVIEHLDQQGTRTVLLACTDLQALIPHHPRMQIFDTMQILADATVSAVCETRIDRRVTSKSS
jgi:aspartate racemase